MRNLLCVLLVGCLLATGCKDSPMLSMNKRMAYADSGATLTTAVAMDQVSQANFDKVKLETVKACVELKKFLDDGLIADLPLGIAKQKIEQWMISKGWAAYIGLVEVSFAWIEVQHVDVDKIGPNNVIIIKEGLSGIERQAQRAKKEWAVPFKGTKVDTTKGKSLDLPK